MNAQGKNYYRHAICWFSQKVSVQNAESQTEPWGIIFQTELFLYCKQAFIRFNGLERFILMSSELQLAGYVLAPPTRACLSRVVYALWSINTLPAVHKKDKIMQSLTIKFSSIIIALCTLKQDTERPFQLISLHGIGFRNRIAAIELSYKWEFTTNQSNWFNPPNLLTIFASRLNSILKSPEHSALLCHCNDVNIQYVLWISAQYTIMLLSN